MDKLFAKFLELFVLGYQVQSNYMYCDGWSDHNRVSLMVFAEIRNDFSKGRIRIDPLSCDEAAKLWEDFPKHLLDIPRKRDTSQMDDKQLKNYSLYLSDFTDALDSRAYQEICESECTLPEGIVAMEEIVFNRGYYEGSC